MTILNLFCSLKVLENIKQTNPLIKQLELTVQIAENQTVDKSLIFTQNCYINNTSQYTGIVEKSFEENFLFSQKDNQSILKNINRYNLQANGIIQDFNQIFRYELFFFYDKRYLKFLSSQIEVDSLSSYIYLIIDDVLIKNFFNSIQTILHFELLQKLENNDRINLYNFN